MTTSTGLTTSSSSRRAFLKRSAAAALASTLAPAVFAAEDNTISIALVGCGSRGAGAAANALSTAGPTRIVAMADVFADRLDFAHQTLQTQFREKIAVPPDRRFVGFDAYRKAIDALPANSVVILATPPVFRPLHLEYAVQKGCHVFMEKSFAVDVPGVRRIIAAGKLAQEKNIKVLGGLMWRHDAARQAVVQKLHDGAIGPINCLRAYFMIGAFGLILRQPQQTEMAHQIANFGNFTWLGGGFFAERAIHNIDFACWIKDALPVSAQGQAGRQTRTAPDDLLDHYFVEYTFADGTPLFAQARHMDACHTAFAAYAHGAKGSAAILANLDGAQARIYSSHQQARKNETWRYAGEPPMPYQAEHDLLFDAIRNNKPCNDAERCAHASMTSILGRIAAESGQLVTWDRAFASNLELAPNLDRLTLQSNPPTLPDTTGRYPIPIPGQTRLL